MTKDKVVEAQLLLDRIQSCDKVLKGFREAGMLLFTFNGREGPGYVLPPQVWPDIVRHYQKVKEAAEHDLEQL
jgi:hypothetical protein